MSEKNISLIDNRGLLEYMQADGLRKLKETKEERDKSLAHYD